MTPTTEFNGAEESYSGSGEKSRQNYQSIQKYAQGDQENFSVIPEDLLRQSFNNMQAVYRRLESTQF